MNSNNHTFVKLAGTGMYLPGKPVSIDEVDNYLGELTEAPVKIQQWLARMKNLMKEMLEVEYYHFAIDPVTRQITDDNITMAVKAAHEALDASGMKPEDVELIIYGSAHQDQMPTASVRIQEMLGIEQCAELSIHANCTSAYKAVLLAHDLISNGRYNNALVLSSNISSSELRAEYYNQPMVKKEELFLRYFLCDGAGALLLKADESGKDGLFLKHTYMESVGGRKSAAMRNKRPAYYMNPRDEFEKGYHHLAQLFNDQLREHFHEADGSVFFNGLSRMIKKYEIDLNHLKYFQVNFPSKHISEMVMEECMKLGIPRETLYTRIASMGYAGPPMAFICLDKMIREEKFEKQDLILSFVTEVSKFMQAGFVFECR